VKKKGETKGDKKPYKKGEKEKMLSKKKWKGANKTFDKKVIKEKESKIKVLTHELLASTLSYLMLAIW
jgi:hypothetical protein